MGQHRRQPTHRSRLLLIVGCVLALLAGLGTAALASTGGGTLDAHQLHLLHERHLGEHHDGGGGDTHHNVHGLTANPDCTLRVPADPLTARGLATPYQLSSAGLTCSEASGDTAAFVQATILDPRTGAVSVYNPLVIDAGSAPTVTAPTPPVIPQGAAVTLWTGFNGNVLKLTGPGADRFVQFPQQSYANSPEFFRALNRSTTAGLTMIPPLGSSGKDMMACPSSRDFSVVDQDQSDNNPQANQFGIANASDERTLDKIDTALGCSPWKDAAGNTSGPMQEAQAAMYQGTPVAVIPSGDPFVFRRGVSSPFLVNLLRAQVDQPSTAIASADTATYCANLAAFGEPRLKADAQYETGAPSLPALGDTFAHQLANRFVMTWMNLGCAGDPPISVTLDPTTGAATGATYK